MDILFDAAWGRFSYRVAGLAVREGRLLVQRAQGDPCLSVPGGHVAFGETGAQTLRREFREELGLEIEVGPLAAVGEVFFRWNGPCQQIGLYYTVNFPGEPWEGLRYSLDSPEKVGFLWVPVEKIQRGEAEFCLPKLAERLGKSGVAHFVDNQLK